MKHDTMERATIPGCWKVWIELEDSIACIAIFNTNLNAHAFAATLDQPTLVTRASTVAIDKE